MFIDGMSDDTEEGHSRHIGGEETREARKSRESRTLWKCEVRPSPRGKGKSCTLIGPSPNKERLGSLGGWRTNDRLSIC